VFIGLALLVVAKIEALHIRRLKVIVFTIKAFSEINK
jgi:hypothetical protein